MSDRTHHPLDLILAHEDLDESARARADAHLVDCAECRELLARLRDLETRAAGVDGLSHGPHDEPLRDLTGTERAAADRSRRALAARVRGGRRPRRLVTGAAGALALAAVLLVMVVGPWRGESPAPGALLADLRLAPALVTRDGPGSGDGATASVTPGAPLTVRLTPARAGWPVVVRVGAAGAAVLTPTPTEPGWRVAADRPAVLPPPGSGVAWRAAPAGREIRWVVALASGPVEDPAALARGIRQVAAGRPAAGEGGLDATAECVRSWLAGRFAGAAVVPPATAR